jgi:hypothetical protein
MLLLSRGMLTMVDAAIETRTFLPLPSTLCESDLCDLRYRRACPATSPPLLFCGIIATSRRWKLLDTSTLHCFCWLLSTVIVTLKVLTPRSLVMGMNVSEDRTASIFRVDMSHVGKVAGYTEVDITYWYTRPSGNQTIRCSKPQPQRPQTYFFLSEDEHTYRHHSCTSNAIQTTRRQTIR